MSYMDMTFCNYYKTCLFRKECHRPLTEKVKASAEKWMKDAPIAMFSEKPSCHVAANQKNESLMEPVKKGAL